MAKNKCFRLIFFLSFLILLKTMTAIFGAFVPSNSTRSDPSSEAEITSVEEDDSFVYFLQDGMKCSILISKKIYLNDQILVLTECKVLDQCREAILTALMNGSEVQEDLCPDPEFNLTFYTTLMCIDKSECKKVSFNYLLPFLKNFSRM